MRVNELILAADAAIYLKLTKGWLARHRKIGDGPVFVKLIQSIRYRIADLDDWVDQRRWASTNDAVVNTGDGPRPRRKGR
jgi:hypothetical protein